MNPPKLIATYSRVSTARQEEEQTVLTQLATLKEFAEKNNHTIVQEYIDEGWSGDILARPSLDKLRQDAKEKIWNAVLVYDPDRLARRYSYQELIMDELREAGIEIIFVTVSAPKNSEDKILHGVRGLFAEYERTKISERFRLGKLRKVKEGNILTTKPLFGYDYIPKQEKIHGYYTINEREASVVRMIYSWVADEGYTQRKIIRRLMELGIKPRISKRGVWSSSTLSRMLQHRAYIGEAHWGKSYAVVPQKPTRLEKYRKMKKTSRRLRPEEEWYKIPVPRIIEDDLFNRARIQIAKNFELCVRNKKNQYLLAGKIRCVCGKTRTGEGPQQGKHLYYRCSDRVTSYPLPPHCFERGINARIADQLIWEKIALIMSSPELITEQANRFIEEQKRKTEHPLIDKKPIQKEIALLRDQEDRYNKAYGTGVFSLEQLTEYLLPVREKIILLEHQIASCKAEKNQSDAILMPTSETIELFTQKAIQMIGNLGFEAKRSIVTNVIEKVVGTKAQLSVYGHIPIAPDVNFFSNHRYGASANTPLGRIESIPFQFEIRLDPNPTVLNHH